VECGQGAQFPEPDQVEVDFPLMRDAGINCILTYTVPSISLLDQALECGIRVIVNVPWMAYKCFLQDRRTQRTIRHEVRQAVGSCRRHPALLMYCVAKEISPAIVRWPGAKKTDPPCRPRVFVRWRVKSCFRAGEGSSLGRY
jgi:beta-galactosidase/beta-glucuronidase